MTPCSPPGRGPDGDIGSRDRGDRGIPDREYRFTIHGARRCVHEGIAMDDVLRVLALTHEANRHGGTPCTRHAVTIGAREITIVTDGESIATVAGRRPAPLREQLKAIRGRSKRRPRPGSSPAERRAPADRKPGTTA